MKRVMSLPIDYGAWHKTLQDGAAHFNLSLSDAQVRLFYRHATLLLQWNQTTNLTAIRDPLEMAVKHFIDSFGPATQIAPMGRVLDAGSGGGFPGLPLKVCWPAIDLTLVDAVRKKTSFLQHLIRELGLKHARAWHTRVESLALRSAPPRFDTIVCRAFTDLSFIISSLSPLLAEKGCIAVWKGRFPDQEIRKALTLLDASPCALTLSVYSYSLPISGAERTLVMLSSATGERTSKESL
jgi:16S rRNA (guanine527-N7)-methyltransferase